VDEFGMNSVILFEVHDVVSTPEILSTAYSDDMLIIMIVFLVNWHIWEIKCFLNWCKLKW